MGKNMVDWKKLEDDVNRAIEKGCPIDDFESKELKEYKYIQKAAEDRLTVLERQVNLIIFIGAVAVSLGVPFIFAKEWNQIEFIAYVVATIIFIGGICWGRYLRPQNKRCRKIILDTEQRILSMTNAEPRQTQLIPNTPSLVQENVPHRGRNIAQIEFIKAGLDFLKLLASATLAGMFLIVVYNLKTAGANFINVNFSIGILGFILIIEFAVYVAFMFKLKDLP